MAFQRSNDKTAAMNVENPRLRGDSGGPVPSHRNTPANRLVLPRQLIRRWRIELGAERIIPGTLLLDRRIDRIGGIEGLATVVEGEDTGFGGNLVVRAHHYTTIKQFVIWERNDAS